MRRKIPVSPLATRFSGPAREAEARLRSLFRFKRKPPAALVVLTLAAALFCGGLVSCQEAEAERLDRPAPSGSDPASAISAPEPSQPAPGDSNELESFSRDTLDGLNLDGVGENDDAVTVTSYMPTEEREDRTVVEAALGDGRTLTWEYPYGACFPSILPAYLTSPDRQSLVIELFDKGSTYGHTEFAVLEAEGDKLAERVYLGDGAEDSILWTEGPDGPWLREPVWGGEIVEREDSPLQALRFELFYYDKWYVPQKGLLFWDGERFVFQPEEYVQEIHPIRVRINDGRLAEHTLKLHIASDSEEYVDQIVVCDCDDYLIQSIRDGAVNLDEEYLFEGLYGGYTDIRDVNFDGSEDFGVLCGRTYNGPMCWFVWDEEEKQFRQAFFSGLDLRLDPENQRQMDYWRDGNIGGDVYVYEYDGRGERTLVEHRRYDGEFPPS